MRNKLYNLVWLFVIFLTVGCEDLEDTYGKYAGDGMFRYTGKCSDVEVMPGWKRLRVSWKNNLDAAIKKVKVSWQAEGDKEPSVRYIERNGKDAADLMDTIFIENLKDLVYSVKVSSMTEDGTESLVEEKYGRPYSEEHEDLRSFTRGVVNFYRLEDKLVVCIDEDNENLKDLVLTYNDTQGQVHKWDIKGHMNDYLSIQSSRICRDYMFLLPEDANLAIDFNYPLTISRRGFLAGCMDEITFKDEVLDLNERIWSTAFSRQMIKKYGENWEKYIDQIESLELDYNFPTFQDLMYLPNLKKVILGKNRYMDGKYAKSHASVTEPYISLVTLQFLKDIRTDFSVERYNMHYFGLDNKYGMDVIQLYKKLGKIKPDFSITELNTSNLDNMPSITPLDIADWEITCSDTVVNGYVANGAGWLLNDDPNIYFEPSPTLGVSVVEVLFDMKKLQRVHGFKVVQYPRNDKGDQNYLLSSIKIEFSEDGYNWKLATNEDGATTIGNAPGEITFIDIPEDKQMDVRYIRLSMGRQKVGTVSGTALFSLRLGSCIPY